MSVMPLPAVTLELLDGAPFTPIAWNNDGKVRDRHGHVVADTNGHEGLAESLALLLNSAAWALQHQGS